MKRNFLITVLLMLVALCSVKAQPVSYEDARGIAAKSFGEMFLIDTKSVLINDEYYEKNVNSQPIYYVFMHEGGGFVIVSGEERTIPILAYSDSGDATNLQSSPNSGFEMWM